jgi:large subunit ribosomal protein L17
MRHLKKNTKRFHRTPEERMRLMRDLSTALIKHGQITTFTGRAKAFRPFFDRLITLAKNAGSDNDLAIRKVRPFLKEEEAKKLVNEIVPRMKNRQGGYTHIYKEFTEFSPHDKSIVAIVE